MNKRDPKTTRDSRLRENRGEAYEISVILGQCGAFPGILVPVPVSRNWTLSSGRQVLTLRYRHTSFYRDLLYWAL